MDNPKRRPAGYIRPSNNAIAAMEQDKAAGGAGLRKLQTKSGEEVTVSLSLADVAEGKRVTMRFKWGGGTMQRLVGTVNAATRPDALRMGWKMIRDEKIVEKEGWSWVADRS